MTWVMVDVEADGPCPGLYSMTEIGLVVIDEKLEPKDMPSFYGQLRPLPGADYVQEALDVCGRTWVETLQFDHPQQVMLKVRSFLHANCKGNPRFISDNNGFDWQFVNFYFWMFLNENPFGHTSTNLGSLYKGMEKDFFTSFKHLRKTEHTHHPVDDCLGNVEALLHMKREMGLKMRFNK